MKLALFDLDHTLIPFDSGMAWTQFLADKGVLPPEAPQAYLGYCHQYVAGTLDIHAMHRASVGPLAAHDMSQIDAWAAEFGRAMSSRLPLAMKSLVQSHLKAGHLCALVTATTRFVAEPLGRLFGLAHIVATDPVTECVAGALRLTGEIAGDPCYREHKVSRVAAWLADLPQGAGLGGEFSRFERSWFYSDSASDLPLLQAVTDPVAVAPDRRLHAVALESGWPVIAAMD